MDITLSKKAAKTLDALDAAAKARIVQGIAGIPLGDVKPLHGFQDGRMRLRIGKYRVVFLLSGEKAHVLAIGSRGDIYK